MGKQYKEIIIRLLDEFAYIYQVTTTQSKVAKFLNGSLSVFVSITVYLSTKCLSSYLEESRWANYCAQLPNLVILWTSLAFGHSDKRYHRHLGIPYFRQNTQLKEYSLAEKTSSLRAINAKQDGFGDSHEMVFDGKCICR